MHLEKKIKYIAQALVFTISTRILFIFLLDVSLTVNFISPYIKFSPFFGSLLSFLITKPRRMVRFLHKNALLGNGIGWT